MRRYRIIKHSIEEGEYLYPQYKDFLFWHHFQSKGIFVDFQDGVVFDFIGFKTLNKAREFIEKDKKKNGAKTNENPI